MTAWVLVQFHPQTLEEWRLKVQIHIELLEGFTHIPKSDLVNYTPEEIIGDMPYEYTETYYYIHIRDKHRKPQWNFGDPAPDKPKKHEANYIWKSLV